VIYLLLIFISLLYFCKTKGIRFNFNLKHHSQTIAYKKIDEKQEKQRIKSNLEISLFFSITYPHRTPSPSPSGAQIERHAEFVPGDVHAIRISPASIDIKCTYNGRSIRFRSNSVNCKETDLFLYRLNISSSLFYYSKFQIKILMLPST
jgi:hypothetical protein